MKKFLHLNNERLGIWYIGLITTLAVFTGCTLGTPAPVQNTSALPTEQVISTLQTPRSHFTEFTKTPASTENPVLIPTAYDNSPTPAPTYESESAPADLAQPGELYAVAGITPGSSLKLQSAPGENEASVGEIPAHGTNLEMISPEEEHAGTLWLPVAYQGLTGWVDKAHLTKQAGVPQPGLAQVANQVIQALKSQDYVTLSTLVHPEIGLRFSPYSYIQDSDLVFPAEQVNFLMAFSRLFNWGNYDGSGEPIELSFPAYYSRFIYDVNFAKPDQIGFNTNDEWGSRINNIREFYPDAVPVDYHFYGFDPKYDGLDWRSLFLVFQPYQDSWKLVGIVHDEWGP